MQASPPREPAAGPCALVIFGASGDLTKRLLLPALYSLQTFGLLPEKFAVVGVARSELGDAAFRSKLAEKVAPESSGETFAAVRLQVDNWRWAGVPFYLRTGKALARRSTRIVVEFKSTPLMLFACDEGPVPPGPDRLIFDIQPQ